MVDVCESETRHRQTVGFCVKEHILTKEELHRFRVHVIVIDHVINNRGSFYCPDLRSHLRAFKPLGHEFIFQPFARLARGESSNHLTLAEFGFQQVVLLANVHRCFGNRFELVVELIAVTIEDTVFV